MDYRQTLYELLYVSIFDPTAEINCVVALANRARTANKRMDITGVLIFDGERFCQFLEGGTKEVVDLFQRITLDERHTEVEMLHEGPTENRRFHKFSLGFSYIADVDVIGSIRSRRGSEARDLLFELQASIDIG